MDSTGARLSHRPVADCDLHEGLTSTEPRTRRSIRTAVFALCLLIGLLFSRWPLSSEHLLTFDSVNFALALEHFNPALHQPQPPGYPLFVLLLWLIRQGTPSSVSALFWSAILLSWCSLLLVWWLGARLFDPVAGRIAALLLLFNPPFWLSSLTNPVRLTYTIGAVVVVLAIERMRSSSRPAAWFYIAAALLGAAGGFRPTLVLILSPLLLFAAFSRRLAVRHVLGAAAVGAVTVACWFGFLAWTVGGLDRWVRILSEYSAREAHTTSLLFGADPGPAAYMALQAVTWTGLGVLSWIWVLPGVRSSGGSIERETQLLFGAWLVPPLLFYAVVHVGDPDHLLVIIPVTCLAGGGLIAHRMRLVGSRKGAVMVVATVLLNVFLFLKPITEVTKAATYPPVAWLHRYVSSVLGVFRAVPADSSTVAIFWEPVFGWRHVTYYFRDINVLLLQHNRSTVIRQLRSTPLKPINRRVIVPIASTYVFVDPEQQSVVEAGYARMQCVPFGCILKPESEVVVRFRGYRLVIGRTSAESQLD